MVFLYLHDDDSLKIRKICERTKENDNNDNGSASIDESFLLLSNYKRGEVV